MASEDSVEARLTVHLSDGHGPPQEAAVPTTTRTGSRPDA